MMLCVWVRGLDTPVWMHTCKQWRL